MTHLKDFLHPLQEHLDFQRKLHKPGLDSDPIEEAVDISVDADDLDLLLQLARKVKETDAEEILTKDWA